MRQYRAIKAEHQTAVLLFRMGDFYVMFFEDAHLAARELGLTLTSRNNGGAADVPLAGVPVKAAAEYVRRLVERGHRVAICEQVEDPRTAKGVVKREVVETITPGAVLADNRSGCRQLAGLLLRDRRGCLLVGEKARVSSLSAAVCRIVQTRNFSMKSRSRLTPSPGLSGISR